MNRRGFLGSILAAGMAPAIVKAEILMPVKKLILPPLDIVLDGNSLWQQLDSPWVEGKINMLFIWEGTNSIHLNDKGTEYVQERFARQLTRDVRQFRRPSRR